jgi:hypothetical protein
VAGVEYKVPNDLERFADADVVFNGNIVGMKESPEMSKVTQHPYTYVYTMRVERWFKGSGDKSLEIVDTGGTDCDLLFGVSHLFIPEGRSLPSSEWRVFARKSQGRLWVLSAHLVR